MEVPITLKATVFLLLKYVTNSQSQSDVIQTSSGPVRGTIVNIDGHKVHQYLGIPFAEPPVDDLRFKKPQPVQPWSETLEANTMPPACIQYAVYPFPWYDPKPGKSEDCLYLNIWVPEDTKMKKAVMFWIYGGSFVHGSNRLPLYNGKALAAVGDVIVVVPNYRLGAFGFFTTDTDDAPANVALYDMLEALKWVNENINAFGGDHNQVTLFGESAGAISVGLFCVSPLTQGLFKRAIMESGSPAYFFGKNDTINKQISGQLAEKVGCSNPTTNIFTSPDKVIKCMREVDALKIAKTLNSFNPNLGSVYFPTYGNDFVPNNARQSIMDGNFHDVSVLIGNNRDEGSLFLTTSNIELFGFSGDKLPRLNISDFEKLLKDLFKGTLKDVPNKDLIRQAVLGRLKQGDYRKNLKIISDMAGDLVIVCPAVYFAESYSKNRNKAFYYSFEHRPSTTPWAEWMGVSHFEEVQFVFGSPLKENKYTDEEVEISTLVVKMWSNFAKYGEPSINESKLSNSYSFQNDLGSEEWPTYSREMPFYLVINANTRKRKQYKLGPQKENCDLFRKMFGFS